MMRPDEDGLDFLLGAMCSLLGLVLAYALPVAALVANSKLRRTVQALELRIAELEADAVARRAARPPAGAGAPTTVAGTQPGEAPPTPRRPDTSDVAAAWAPVAALPEAVPQGAAPPASPSRVDGEGAVPGPSGSDPGATEPAVEATSPGSDAASEGAAPPRGVRLPPPIPPPGPARPRMGAEAIGVWILAVPGGLALLLAAVFALREAIAAGLVGPGVRFALGAAVGCFALLASELARARRYDVPAAALGGGGAGVVYAVLYAGHARYGLLGQEVAFGLMVATTAITLLAAERRNSRFMAALALVGGYLTPLLLSTGENKAVAYFGYLALLDAGLLWAASRRRWTTLIAVAGLATAALYLGWVIRFYGPDQVVVGLAAPIVLSTLFLLLPARRSTALPEAVAGALGGFVLLYAAIPYLVPTIGVKADRASGLALPVSDGDFVWMALAFVLAVPVGARLVAARRAGAWLDAVAVGTAACFLLIFGLGWAFVDDVPWVALSLALLGVPLLVAGSLFWLAPVGVSSLLLVTIGLGAAPAMPLYASLAAALGALGALYGHTWGPRPTLLVGLLAGAAPLLVPIAAALSGGELVAEPGTIGAWFLACAVVYAAYAFPPFWRPRAADLFGALSAALVGPVLFFAFHRIWVDTLGDAFVGALPVILGAVTLLAAVSLIRAVRVRADDRELAILLAAVLGFAAAAVPLQLEEAWLTVGWALEVALLAGLSRRLTHPIVRGFAGVLALAVAVRLLLNPDALDYGGGEGWILLNWTLYTWGVPGVCLLVAARLLRNPEWMRTGLRTLAVLLFFALVNLEVAHAFAHDDTLSFTSEDLAESMTRSISWAAYGLLLIGIGTVQDRRGARLAGLSFALLGALKVFVVDLWSLSGFARVGSFAGLAVTLLVGAIAFQRIVLKDRKS